MMGIKRGAGRPGGGRSARAGHHCGGNRSSARWPTPCVDHPTVDAACP